MPVGTIPAIVHVELPQTLLQWALAGAAVATVVFFGAGLTLYFERATRQRWVLSLHYGSMLLAAVQTAGIVVLPNRDDVYVMTAIGMYTLAMLLFLGAIEAAKRTRLQRSFVDLPLPDRLITDGPFRWIRHPFCAGYVLAAAAGPVATAHWLMFLVSPPLIGLAVAAAVREERVWLASGRAAEYHAYQQRTGMLVPFVGRGQ